MRGVLGCDGSVYAVLCSVWCGSVVLRVVRGCSVTRSIGLHDGVWNGVVWDAE